MKYVVSVQAINREYYPMNKRDAIETAIDEAAKNKDSGVFIEYFCKSDGRVWYLNPDRNHDLVRRDWSQTL